MARKVITASIGIALVLACAVASCADCRQFFRQHVVYQQAVIAQPVVLYQAGVNVEQDALAERIAQRVEARILQRLQAGPGKQSVVQVPDAQSVESPEPPALAMAQHCSKCHSGAKPKAQLVFDGATALECFQITKALRLIADEKMPKDHKLTPEQKGQIMQELLDLEHRDTLPAAPAEVPKE